MVMCGYRFKGEKNKKEEKRKKKKRVNVCESVSVTVAKKVRKVMNDLSSHANLLNFDFRFFSNFYFF